MGMILVVDGVYKGHFCGTYYGDLNRENPACDEIDGSGDYYYGSYEGFDNSRKSKKEGRNGNPILQDDNSCFDSRHNLSWPCGGSSGLVDLLPEVEGYEIRVIIAADRDYSYTGVSFDFETYFIENEE